MRPQTLPLFPTEPLASTKPEPTLRKYQQRFIINARAQIILKKKRILGVGPTGCGKSVVIAAIIRLCSLPVLFVAHRKELLDQIVDHLATVGIGNVGVIRGADARYNPAAKVQVGSIQTLARRDLPFLEEKQILIFIDEAHRAASDGYVALLAKYPNAIVIGFTATPTRLDGKPLGGELFEVLEVIATYAELLKNKDWLVAPDVFSGGAIDLSSVPTAGSDFDEDKLAEVMHTSKLEGDIVNHWLRRAHMHPVFQNGVRVPMQMVAGERRRTLVFAVNIAHSQSICLRFAAAGVRVAHLDANTPEKDRDQVFRDLRSGKLEVVCQCLIAIEGIDIPEVKCIISARPTQSITIWRQKVGREMRPWGDVVPLLLDHAGNFDRLGCPFEDLQWSLKTKAVRRSGAAPMKLCPKCYAYCAAGLSTCPYCGEEFKAQARHQDLSETSVELQARQTEPEVLKRNYFDMKVIEAKSKGFKPGFAASLYKDHYGAWPPREWSDAVKTAFASDGQWQTALARRLERKAKAAAAEEAEEAALAGNQIRKAAQMAAAHAVAAAPEVKVMVEPEIVTTEPEIEVASEVANTERVYDDPDMLSDWLEGEGIE